MGLDTSHNCWHGPYSSFSRFRKSLCLQIGVDINAFADYGGDSEMNSSSISHDIKPLIDHSDCDGELTVEESKRVIKGLDSILANFNSDLGQDYDFKEKIIQFKKGLEDAVSLNEIVYFH